MEEKEPYQKDIESIRQLMERSVKFISLSGLSGILAGIYALAGAAAAYFILPGENQYGQGAIDPGVVWNLALVAVAVLVISVSTGVSLSVRKAKKLGVRFWDATSKRLVLNLSIPLVAGGIFILILLSHGHIGMIAPSFLIFYGLALVNASPGVYEEVRTLGYSEIVLGLLCAWFTGYGLIFWATGFGVLHILYGAIMYKKYDA